MYEPSENDAIKLSFTLKNEDETTALGNAISSVLTAGDTILLEGPIGAGKSHFARSIIRARLAETGLSEDIPSPTFTLVQTYFADAVEIWHSDLYRLTSVDEVYELGLEDAFSTAICLVEWPERLGALAPNDALVARLDIFPDYPDKRTMTLSSPAAKWNKLQAPLQAFDPA